MHKQSLTQGGYTCVLKLAIHKCNKKNHLFSGFYMLRFLPLAVPFPAVLLAPPTGGDVLGLSMTTVSLTTGSSTHLYIMGDPSVFTDPDSCVT